MTTFSEIKVPETEPCRYLVLSEKISVSIAGSQVTVRMETLLSAERGGLRQIEKPFNLDLSESFAQVLRRAQVALREAYGEIGENLLEPLYFEFKSEYLGSEKFSPEQLEEIRKRRAETQAYDDARCPYKRLELALKSALMEAGITLSE